MVPKVLDEVFFQLQMCFLVSDPFACINKLIKCTSRLPMSRKKAAMVREIGVKQAAMLCETGRDGDGVKQATMVRETG